MTRNRLFPVLLLWFTARAFAGTSDWSGFQNGGQVIRDGDPPIEWATNEFQWTIDLAGYGQSSPAIDEQLIYVTSVSGQNKETLIVQAIDRATGEQKWVHELANSTPEENTNYVSRAAPSPVIHDAGVIAFFEGGNIVSLDAMGTVRWKRNLVADLGPIRARHGLAASLEQNEEHVFVWVERQKDPYLLALDKATGTTVWKAQGLGGTSWSSPRLIPVGKSFHLVMSGAGKLIGIDPRDGTHVWTFDDIAGNSTPTPVPCGNGRFLIGASKGRGDSAGQDAAKANGLIQVTSNESGTFNASFVWQAKRATSTFGSPIASEGHAYFVNRAGVVYCLDLLSGEEKYAERIGASVWATPVGVAGRIYLFGKNGTTTVIATGEKFRKIGASETWSAESKSATSKSSSARGGPVLYAGVIVGDELVLRRGDRLYRLAK